MSRASSAFMPPTPRKKLCSRKGLKNQNKTQGHANEATFTIIRVTTTDDVFLRTMLAKHEQFSESTKMYI